MSETGVLLVSVDIKRTPIIGIARVLRLFARLVLFRFMARLAICGPPVSFQFWNCRCQASAVKKCVRSKCWRSKGVAVVIQIPLEFFERFRFFACCTRVIGMFVSSRRRGWRCVTTAKKIFEIVVGANHTYVSFGFFDMPN